MDYRVVITIDAENDLHRHIEYILEKFKNEQAAKKNIIDDFEETKNNLAKSAGSLQYCENPRLNIQGYKRINYLHHDYFMLFRVVEDMAIVDNIFHFKDVALPLPFADRRDIFISL